jgi:hypothetical protein
MRVIIIPYFSSPRSLEALRRLCYEQHELLIKTKEDFMNDPVPSEFADDAQYFFEVKAEHYEKRRQEKLKHLLEVYRHIILFSSIGKREYNSGTNKKYQQFRAYKGIRKFP